MVDTLEGLKTYVLANTLMISLHLTMPWHMETTQFDNVNFVGEYPARNKSHLVVLGSASQTMVRVSTSFY